jgi:hypothetical protein
VVAICHSNGEAELRKRREAEALCVVSARKQWVEPESNNARAAVLAERAAGHVDVRLLAGKVPVLVGARQTHGVLQGHRVLELDVDAEMVAEASRVDGDMLLLRDAITPGQQLQELVMVLCDRAGALQLDEFAERVAARWGAEAAGDQVDEAFPSGHALVAF